MDMFWHHDIGVEKTLFPFAGGEQAVDHRFGYVGLGEDGNEIEDSGGDKNAGAFGCSVDEMPLPCHSTTILKSVVEAWRLFKRHPCHREEQSAL